MHNVEQHAKLNVFMITWTMLLKETIKMYPQVFKPSYNWSFKVSFNFTLYLIFFI